MEKCFKFTASTGNSVWSFKLMIEELLKSGFSKMAKILGTNVPDLEVVH
jgi:hypothetical protein